jgi:hypothetical protein
MSPAKSFNLENYVDVDGRLTWFFERFPEGSLQAEVLHFPTADLPILVVKAYAYRSMGDVTPGIGTASEVYPGTTPYTKGSELMNAETSAWGRALAAIGAPTKGHVASRDEVKGASSRREAIPPQAEPKVEGGSVVEMAPVPGKEQGQPDLPLTTLPADHRHRWGQSPTLKKYVVCQDPACRKVVLKEDANHA